MHWLAMELQCLIAAVTVGRKGLAIIKDVQQAFLGHHSLGREYHKGYQERDISSKRGAVSPVTASTKLGCFLYW